jgi:single-strand DNA-binding protein
MDSAVVLQGNLASDVELTVRKDTPIAVFRLAVNRRTRKEDGTFEDAETSFFRVVAFRRLAENCKEALSQGDRVIVTGHLRQRSWTDGDEKKHSIVEVEATDIGASLRTAAWDKPLKRDAE